MSIGSTLSSLPSALLTRLKSARPPIRWLVIGVLVVLLIVLVVITWNFLNSLPFWFWELTFLCVAVLAVIWWFTRGLRWYDRRRVMKQELGDLKAGDPTVEAEARRNLVAAVGDAASRIDRSPQLEAGGVPLYRIPWFLFVGDEAASQTRLLKSATSIASPFPPPVKGVGGDLFWTFWFFKRLIAIETSPVFVCEREELGPRGIWYHALQLLHQYREKLPINGVVAVVAIDHLWESPENLRAFTLNVRRLVDEAMHHLEVDIPLYLIITGLERLPGFATFVKHLPAAAKDHAVGERIDWDKPGSWSRWERGGEIYEAVRARFHAIRLSALRKETETLLRKDIFEFVERFTELKDGFATLLRALLEGNPFQIQPKLRGVYFVSTGDTPVFVKDLFTRFLPSDQPLANRGGRWPARRWVRASVSALSLLTLSTVLSVALVSAHRTDRELSTLAGVACLATAVGDSDLARRVSALTSCREKLQAVTERWQDSGLSFGFRRHRAPFLEAQGRFIAAFNASVMSPLDSTTTATIASGAFGPAEYLSVVQRLGVLRACATQEPACAPFPKQFVFDPQSAQRLDRLLGLAQPLTMKEHDALFASYVSFAQWQTPADVATQTGKLEAQLEQMHRVHPLHPQDWVKWAAQRYETYSLDRFWKPPRAIEPEYRVVLPQAPALYTAAFYHEVLLPLQSAAYRYIPDLKGPLDTFTREYWTAYFRSWAAFFRDFYQGARLWSPDYMGLARRLVEEPLPYERLYSDMEQNMWSLPLRMPMSNRMALLWLDIKNDWSGTPHYVARTFRQTRAGFARFGAVDAPTWLLAVTETHKKVWPETSGTVKKFVQAVQQDAKGQDSYALARELFKSRGAGGSGLAQEFPKLNQALDAPPDKFVQRMGGDDQIGWAGMKGPGRLVLIVLTARAGEYLQKHWEDDIVKPAAAMNKAEQDVVLWGEKGKINGFITDQLSDFVLPKERTPVQVLDITLPFSSGYNVLVNKAAAGSASKDPFLIGVFSFRQPSTLGGAEEGSQGTEFSLACRGSTVSLKSKAKLVADRSMKVYWSPDLCDRARIEVYLPDQPPAPAAAQVPTQQPPAPAAPASLAKDYMGRDGFLQLLEDFKSGSRTFALTDFRSSYSPSDWQAMAKSAAALGITSVKIYLDIEKSPEAVRFIEATHIIAGGLPAAIMQ